MLTLLRVRCAPSAPGWSSTARPARFTERAPGSLHFTRGKLEPLSFPVAARYARQAHNLKVRGSNPLPATNFPNEFSNLKNSIINRSQKIA
jgi:hypothetical protein